MKNRLSIAVVAFGVFVAGGVFRAPWVLADAPGKTPVHALPEDPRAVVISYDYTGGMIRRLVPGPLVTVARDGTVVAADPLERGKEFKMTLSAEELQGLLHEFLDVQGFGKMKDEDLKLKPLPGGPMMVISDGVTSKITIHVPEINNTLSGYAIEKEANGGPESARNRFVAIRERLERLRYITLLGGNAELQKFVEAAGAREKKDLPNEPLVMAEDLGFVRVDQNYVVVAQFSHRVAESHGWHMVFVTLTRTVEGKMEVKAEVGGSVVEK